MTVSNYKILFNARLFFKLSIFHEWVKLSNIRLRHINLESKVRINSAAIVSLLYPNAIIIHLYGAAMELYCFHGHSIAISEL